MPGSLPGLRPLPELGGKGGVIELTALVVFAQKVAYDDEGGLGDAVLRVSSASVETVQRTTFCSGQVAL